ncbi:YbaY family lipoprotein [Hymenobacter sp. 15J16-1T3B]|uniref:YbaY family lipoprotein n=1 Tax=Hymenobacter sp. 15J16-1T3B TaxID=2886941 RepID=UPI001D130334|nr:YbaY family lipoprotein [Hymenobacter sp. 15J16-1T3B]MCC3160482.1 YbaY family lipoprotein [Hymenobacter sp. 15J16-1T3B]
MKTTVLPAVLLLLLAACAKPTARTSAAARAVAAVQDSITGTVTYRERLALPPGAVLNVQLQDVSRPGAPATVVAEATVLVRGGQVPLAFSLPYDTLRIDPTNTYAVQARIGAEGQPLLANAAAYPVITRGNAKRVQMMLRRVAP